MKTPPRMLILWRYSSSLWLNVKRVKLGRFFLCNQQKISQNQAGIRVLYFAFTIYTLTYYSD